jgi:hypothetical protein
VKIQIEKENVLPSMNPEKLRVEKVGPLKEVESESLHPLLPHLKEPHPLFEEENLPQREEEDNLRLKEEVHRLRTVIEDNN